MDPLTIASAVAKGAESAWHVGKALYDLIESTKVVNQSVKALASEAHQLGNVCDSVDKQLRRLPGLEPVGEDAQLFSSIRMQLSECDRTMTKLKNAIKTVSTPGSNFAGQAVRQVKLNLSKEEISESRAQIQAHTANLQISLQLVNLKATFLAPKLANQELLAQMSKLQGIIADQGLRIDAALLQCAKDYISSGSTLYEESVANGTAIGFTNHPQYDPHIAGWISTLSALRLDVAEPDTVNRATSHGDDSSIGVGEEAHSAVESSFSHSSDPPVQPFLTTPDEEDFQADSEEDQVALDLAKAAKEEGLSAFENEEYAEAESLLREALTLIQELPLQLRRT